MYHQVVVAYFTVIIRQQPARTRHKNFSPFIPHISTLYFFALLTVVFNAWGSFPEWRPEFFPLGYRRLGALFRKAYFWPQIYDIQQTRSAFSDGMHATDYHEPLLYIYHTQKLFTPLTCRVCQITMSAYFIDPPPPSSPSTQCIFGVGISQFTSLLPFCKSSKVHVLNSMGVQLYTLSHTKERKLHSRKHSNAVVSEFRGLFHL
jgi:hypothetical protein